MLVWVLTFLVYMCYHMTRKIPSVVKGTLDPKVTFDAFGDPINDDAGWYPFSKYITDSIHNAD